MKLPYNLLAGLFFSTVIAAPALASTAPQDLASSLEYSVVAQWNATKTPIDMVNSLDGKYVFVLTEDHEVQVYDPQGNLQGTIPVADGVTAIDVSPRAELLYTIDKDSKEFSAIALDFVKNLDISDSPVKGPADAPVTIILFTDFECPYCKKLEPLLQAVMEKNAKNVKLVFKNMPLDFHKFADKSARAALAAEKQGKFWEFHDLLFQEQKLSDQAIENIAGKLKLNIEQWKKDMNSPQIAQKVARDIAIAQEAGVTGTPTLFINGHLLKNRSMQGFQEMIDAAMEKK